MKGRLSDVIVEKALDNTPNYRGRAFLSDNIHSPSGVELLISLQGSNSR